MISAFLTLAVVLAGIYALLDLALVRGLIRTSRIQNGMESQTPSVSVLVCARNEEAGIAPCLESILAQQYMGNWDLWIANDRSTDATSQILEDYRRRFPERIHILAIDSVPHGHSPKKHAITRLVEKCQGEILLLTDADCIVPNGWIHGMIQNFDPFTDFVSGYSYFPQDSLLQGVQALDFLSHRTVDAAGIGLGIPITACGQNLGYRRKLFLELGGFEGVQTVTSGDDDLLMHKLAAKNPKAIRYARDPATFVWSTPAPSWAAAWEQRKRWASKTHHYSLPALLVLVPVFLFYVLIFLGLPLSLILLIINGNCLLFLCFLFLWVWKTTWDALVMGIGMRLFHAGSLWPYFPLTAILHVPVIVCAVLWGFRGKFQWKG